jgi:hypothetical protein
MTYEEILRLDGRVLLITPYAQAWWRWYRDKFADPVMASIVDDELERLSPDTARERLDARDFGAVESEPEA